MTDKSDQFRALAMEAQPLQSRLAEIALDQCKLSAEIGLEIVQTAFPDAKLIRKRACAEIKPTDMAKSANETVAALRQHGITPTEIWYDDARMVVTLIL